MAKDRRIELLKDVPLFWGVPDKELKKIAAITEVVNAPAGKVLMAEGATGYEMFIIAAGSAKVTRNGRKIRSAGVGEAVGELALLDQGPRTATVTAETDMTVYALGSRSFAGLLMDAPVVGIRLLKSMAIRLRTAEKNAVH